MNTIPARLQQARINSRKSIYQAAGHITDCTPDLLRMWENNDVELEPTIKQMLDILQLYEVTLKWLISGDDSDDGHIHKQARAKPLKTPVSSFRLNSVQRIYLAALNWGGSTNEREIQVMDYFELVRWGMVKNDVITAFGIRYAQDHLEAT
jgi:transcriptional regulator with XRE-family HTH domain